MKKLLLCLLLLSPIALGNQTQVKILGGSDSTIIGNSSTGIHTNLRNSSGTEIGVSGSPIRIDPTGSTIQPISISAGNTEDATFTVSAIGATVTTNGSLFSLVNTSGSTVKIKIREIRLINVQASIVIIGAADDFRLLRITGHSVGTALTVMPHDTTDTLNASVTARTGATVTGEGTVPLRRWFWSSDEWGPGAQDVESTDHTMQTLIPAYVPLPRTKPIVLNANEGITIKCVTTTLVGTFDVTVLFTQE